MAISLVCIKLLQAMWNGELYEQHVEKKSRLTLTLALIGFLMLNCFGFCWSKFRFLSDQERMEFAVQKALNFYKDSDSWGEFDGLIADRSAFGRNRYKEIPYKDSKEFFVKNPNCCKLSRSAIYSEGIHRVGIYGCLTGYSPYLVSINATVFYKIDGQRKIDTSRIVYRMSSCGNLHYPD